MDNRYDVSIVVLTYNPRTSKLIGTLKTIIAQKDINMQIVVADDGSKVFPRKEIDELFVQTGFTDFAYSINEENVGTVMNCYNALSCCEGKYIKHISPGDELRSPDTMDRWLSAVTAADAAWSFGEVDFYREGTDKEPVDKPRRPLVVSSYKKGNTAECRKNYVLYNDLCIGAATMVRKDILEKYLKKITGKVKYGEDNIYRLMMADGVCPLYFEDSVVYYEYGDGISTSDDSPFTRKLREDMSVTTKMMCEPQEGDDKFTADLRTKLKKISEDPGSGMIGNKLFGLKKKLEKKR